MIKLSRIRVIVISVLFLMLAISVAAFAEEIPMLPQEYYGTLTLNGTPAPVGTELVAKIDGVQRGSLITTSVGKYGGPGTFDEKLVVSGQYSDIAATVTFWINGIQAEQTAVYQPGELVELALTAGGGGTASTAVSIAPPSKTVQQSETFTMDVIVAPGKPIAGAQFDLSFDPAVLAVLSVTEGGLLKQNGADTYFQPGTIDNTGGKVSGAAGTITTPGGEVEGAGALATVTFSAKGAGSTNLTLSNVKAGDKAGQSVPVTVSGGSVTVKEQSSSGNNSSSSSSSSTTQPVSPQPMVSDIEKAKQQGLSAFKITTDG